MKTKIMLCGALAAMAVSAAPRAEMTFPDVSSVKIDDAFWSPRYALWRGTTIPDVLEKLETRSHVVENLKLAAKSAKGGHRGAYFFDGLLCESLRGASDYLAVKPDAALEAKIDRFVDLLAAAQRPDGYLNTRCQVGDGDKRRWGDNGGLGLDQHEIYDAGCLVEAGVHYYRATGKAKLLGCAMRFANLLCDTMGPPPKRNLIPTHSLAEEAMLKLAWLLRDDPSAARKAGVEGRPGDYLALVRFWLDTHGRHCGEPDWAKLGWNACKRVREMTAVPRDPQWRPCWGDYQMDRVPLDEYVSIEGHAVRATLLCLGIATYAEAAGDLRYLGLAERFWDSMVGRKMYISGGVGADAKFEAFVPDYVLPPNAYLETCAAIGSAFFSTRMSEITGDGKYMDEVERVAYNALLTAVGANGCTYTYQNPLNTEKGARWEWHGCPCCPPMFLKFTGALPGYVFARRADGYAVNLFIGGETAFADGAAGRVRLVQKTRYPTEGAVSVEVEPERPARFVLRVRVPGWARGVENPYGLYLSDGARRWSMALNGQVLEPRIEKGYAVLDREWKKGDSVTLSLDVSERIVRARPEVKDVAGCVARMKGPVLLAEENGRLIPYYDVANNGAAPHKVWLPEDKSPMYDEVELKGTPHSTAGALSLEEGFKAPPDSAKPHTWYHLMNGNVTKEGITCDFEALAKAGIGGVQMFDAGWAIEPGKVDFNSPEWFDMLLHAAREARRLGLEICIPNCSGWSSSGGPWNMPSNGMKQVVFTETPVQGPAAFKGKLPRTKKDNGFYADIAVLAFPTPSDDTRRIAGIEAKTFAVRGDVARDTASATSEQVVSKERTVDLTSRLAADGTLAWNVPAGGWTILRVGYICNGRHNHPASAKGKGLEVDKLSASALDYHFDQYVTRLCRLLGPLAGDVASGLNNVLVDSYEVGSQNWTQGLERLFEKRMGYSLVPYLPTFTGRVVGSVDESERFLEDFRRVVADLFAENYAGRMAELCHRHGLKLSLEPYGNCPADDFQYGQDVDIPMGEFWSSAVVTDHGTNVGSSKRAASLAHVWGRRYAATESFTASPENGGRWMTTPFSLKAQGDRVYAKGVNRIIYHRFVHQPWPGNKYLPGMTLGRWGMHFDRTQTWWDLAGDWFRYQSRCQWMLQEGTFVADVLFFCGEQAPNLGGYEDGKGPSSITLPVGYDWDVCATKAMHLLKVEKGRVVAPGGVSYALLALPPRETVSEKMLAAVERLLDAGAKVCCPLKPTRAPGLAGYPLADARIRERAERVWAKGVMACRPEEALKRLGIAPDFTSAENDPNSGASYIHRRRADADWYFVALNNAEPKSFEASFRLTGRQPEIWDAEKGTITDAPQWREEKGRTVVTLEFPPSGSAFVVFRRKAEGMKHPASSAGRMDGQKIVRSVPLSGPWQVTFPVDWYTGGTSVKSFGWPTLKDWTSDGDPDVKYFSGTATYRVSCPAPRVPPGGRVLLDLGEVKNFAVATVNGKTFPVLWRPPYRVDVTDALDPKAGSFSLEVKVTNLWPNRLIGDDFLPDDCGWETIMYKRPEIGIKKFPQWVKEGRHSPSGRHTFTTWKHWSKEDKLLPSGLLGPVALRMEAPDTPYLKSLNPGSALRTVERVDGGTFKVLIYGNSIALHGPKPDIGWTNNWGMAASAPEKDFAHLVVAGLEAKRGERADFRIRNIAALERNMRTNVSTVAEIAADVAFAPDYVVLAIGENMPRANAANADAYSRLLVNVARPFAASAKRPKIAMRSPFGLSGLDADCTARAAKEVGATFVDAGPLGTRENRAFGRFANRAVAGHPGDLGMRRLADLILSGLLGGD